jgi:uncharacterized membrane protein
MDLLCNGSMHLRDLFRLTFDRRREYQRIVSQLLGFLLRSLQCKYDAANDEVKSLVKDRIARFWGFFYLAIKPLFTKFITDSGSFKLYFSIILRHFSKVDLSGTVGPDAITSMRSPTTSDRRSEIRVAGYATLANCPPP